MTLKNSLSRNVLILGAVSFLNDASSELIGALLPLFITQLGGGALSVGLLGGLREALSNFLKILSGYLSDRVGRKKVFVIAGYGISALFKLAIPFSKTPFQVIAVSSLERLGKGIRTAPRDAILSLSGEVERSFSIHRALDTFGALTGVILALLLTSALPVRESLLIGALISFLSLPLLLFLKEPRGESKGRKREKKTVKAEFKKFLLASTLFSLSSVSFMFFILKGKEVGGSTETALLLYGLYNLVYATTSLFFKKLSEELSPFKALSLGYLTFSLYLLSLGLSNSIPLLVFSAFLFGFSSGITDPGQRAAVGLLTGRSKRGTYYGLFHFLSGSAILTGNLLIGWAWELYQSTALIFLAVLSLAAALITYRIR
ncbi:MFS transporter [Thermovibrio sp.]